MSATLTRAWWDRVPPAAVERFVNLVERQRRLGRRPRVLLIYGERLELDVIEQQLDELLVELSPAIAAAAAELVEREGGAA
jgi:hypothetical protein